MRLIFFGVFVLISPLLAAQDERVMVDRAMAYYDDEKYEAAAHELELAFLGISRDAEARALVEFTRAKAYYNFGFFSHAFELFEELLQLGRRERAEIDSCEELVRTPSHPYYLAVLPWLAAAEGAVHPSQVAGALHRGYGHLLECATPPEYTADVMALLARYHAVNLERDDARWALSRVPRTHAGYALAIAHRVKGQSDEAVKLFRIAAETPRLRERSAFAILNIARRTGDHGLASEAAERRGRAGKAAQSRMLLEASVLAFDDSSTIQTMRFSRAIRDVDAAVLHNVVYHRYCRDRKNRTPLAGFGTDAKYLLEDLEPLSRRDQDFRWALQQIPTPATKAPSLWRLLLGSLKEDPLVLDRIELLEQADCELARLKRMGRRFRTGVAGGHVADTIELQRLAREHEAQRVLAMQATRLTRSIEMLARAAAANPDVAVSKRPKPGLWLNRSGCAGKNVRRE